MGATATRENKPALARRCLRARAQATPEQGEGTFKAVVSTFNEAYDVGWGWEEMILPGCFDDSIAAQPALPVMYEHDWKSGPVGVTTALTSSDSELTAEGRLYLGMSERIDIVYQSMIDEALREFSIAFWPDEILWDKDQPMLDQIAKGDLAEITICIRGAGVTELLDLRAGAGWVDADREGRRREVSHLRSLRSRHFSVPDLGRLRNRPPRKRQADAGDGDEDLDAVFDEMAEALAEGDIERAADLLPSARATAGELIEASRTPRQREAIPEHSTGTTDDTWDAAANVKNLSNDDGETEYREMYAWVDPEGDADKKNAYSFPHHMVDSDGKVGDAATVGCSNGIGRLNAGDSSDDWWDDREGVHAHLAKHLTDAGQDAPELKSDSAPSAETPEERAAAEERVWALMRTAAGRDLLREQVAASGSTP